MTSEKKLKQAVTLLLISLVLGAIAAILPNILIPGRLFTLLYVLAMILVYSFIIWQIKLKQNWARVLFVVLYVLVLFGTVSNFMMIFSNIPQALAFYNQSMALLLFINALILVERIFEAIVICLLFSKDTSLLFKKPK